MRKFLTIFHIKYFINQISSILDYWFHIFFNFINLVSYLKTMWKLYQLILKIFFYYWKLAILILTHYFHWSQRILIHEQAVLKILWICLFKTVMRYMHFKKWFFWNSWLLGQNLSNLIAKSTNLSKSGFLESSKLVTQNSPNFIFVYSLKNWRKAVCRHCAYGGGRGVPSKFPAYNQFLVCTSFARASNVTELCMLYKLPKPLFPKSWPQMQCMRTISVLICESLVPQPAVSHWISVLWSVVRCLLCGVDVASAALRYTAEWWFCDAMYVWCYFVKYLPRPI